MTFLFGFNNFIGDSLKLTGGKFIGDVLILLTGGKFIGDVLILLTPDKFIGDVLKLLRFTGGNFSMYYIDYNYII
jgi:hypothetical protein